jgi:hypothetical protein
MAQKKDSQCKYCCHLAAWSAACSSLALQTVAFDILSHLLEPYLYARESVSHTAEESTVGYIKRAVIWRNGIHSLTKSSNPNRVPVNSRSFFRMTVIREPMHLSINSVDEVRAGDVSRALLSGTYEELICTERKDLGSHVDLRFKRRRAKMGGSGGARPYICAPLVNRER